MLIFLLGSSKANIKRITSSPYRALIVIFAGLAPLAPAGLAGCVVAVSSLTLAAALFGLLAVTHSYDIAAYIVSFFVSLTRIAYNHCHALLDKQTILYVAGSHCAGGK